VGGIDSRINSAIYAITKNLDLIALKKKVIIKGRKDNGLVRMFIE